jgi:predicted RNA-binding protein YlqC (UPF0109 family)
MQQNMINEDEILEIVIPLLRDVLSGFIGHPDKLDLEPTRVGTILSIRVSHHPDDYPKIIGKQGANISAVIKLFSEIGRRMGVNIKITVMYRPKPANASPMPAFVNNPDWNRDDFLQTLNDVLEAICDNPVRIDEDIVDNQSLFKITPQVSDLPTFDREIEVSLEVIFRAIGQQQGRRLNLAFCNEQTG